MFGVKPNVKKKKIAASNCLSEEKLKQVMKQEPDLKYWSMISESRLFPALVLIKSFTQKKTEHSLSRNTSQIINNMKKPYD